ncbi:hypothetical protein RRG08_026524 [Elysia crispata]|uniref:Reverse transcriptase/retrotransposon-derived protein RNase H-like domain-containing protein n=1 Tax=Elysia crispata TaxID=231223 RepID=A0AAE0Y3U0_9GAST|nr:hypothetical protein RRG08_026524 [Elysia crispata]
MAYLATRGGLSSNFWPKTLTFLHGLILELGYTEAVKHRIPVTSEVPIAQPYRRIPPSQFEDVRQHIQELADKGVNRPSSSPYASPILILGLKLNPEKCRLCARNVHYLGHVISEEGIATDPDKSSAVNDWPNPKTTREVRSFLGLASYYLRFVLKFADIARPLHQIIAKANADHGYSKKKPVSIASYWNRECQLAFNALKSALTTTPVLGTADFSLPFQLEVVASFNGLDAILSQD